ncbi:MAG: hypothetical protein H6659_09595 [Ardenticatenaceae bacterium]|mgnify:CR=1 FL=1|nr:hypothetical protein [Ardenticatenaceae bacterium]
MSQQDEWPPIDPLEAQWQVHERPFTSDVPLVGPLIARLRQMWNDVATTWYVRPLLQQQNDLNRLLVARLQDHEARLIAQDHEQTDRAHDLAEMTAQLAQMNRRLHAIEEHLARLEPEQSKERKD